MWGELEIRELTEKICLIISKILFIYFFQLNKAIIRRNAFEFWHV